MMINEITPYFDAFPTLDVYMMLRKLLDADAWKDMLHIVRHEQTFYLSSQRDTQEQIITHLHEALRVRESHSIQWALVHTLLALTYTRRTSGDKQINIAQASSHCDHALTVLTREDDPQLWALLQLTRAEICRNMIHGERQKYLQQALAYCQQALQVHPHDLHSFQCASTHATLGHVYSEIGYFVDEQLGMLDLALAQYQYALPVLTEETAPVQWAIIQQGLAIIALMRQDNDKASHLQQAITLGQSSLRVLTHTMYPLEWAKVHALLGEAYRQATVYEPLQELYSGRAVMQEQALRHIEAALQVYTPHDYHLEWARVKKCEGMIYRERMRGKHAENIAHARCCFQAAASSTLKQ